MAGLLRDTIAKNLKDLRTERGMTQEQLAREIGITWRNYQRYEKAQTVPKPENLEALAKALGVDQTVILGQGPGPKGEQTTIEALTRELAVLQSQVHVLTAWKRDRDREWREFLEAQKIELEA